jgi:hypothetical protein
MLLWGGLGVGFYLLALLWSLPATQVVGWLKLPLSEVRGSFWQGSANLRAPQLQLDKLSWRVSLGVPWSTPLVVNIRVDDANLRAQSQLGLQWNGAVLFRDTQLDTRLNSPLIASRLPVPLDGTLHFKADSARWSSGFHAAQGAQLDISELRLLMGEPLLLGSFVAQAEVNDGKLNTTLRDTAGALQLRGEIKGDAASGVSLQARAQARPGAPQALLDTLNLLPAAPEGGALLQTQVPASLLVPWLAQTQTKLQ